jgi:hypothetical protein
MGVAATVRQPNYFPLSKQNSFQGKFAEIVFDLNQPLIKLFAQAGPRDPVPGAAPL